jgi:hypothetical protein
MANREKPKSHLRRNISIVAIVIIVLVVLFSVIVASWMMSLRRPPGLPTSYAVVDGSFTINASSFKVYPFELSSEAVRWRFEVQFAVPGNNTNTVRVYVLNSTNFVNWENGAAFNAAYDSGQVTQGNFETYALPVGEAYFLVFDNTFSSTSINVNAHALDWYWSSISDFQGTVVLGLDSVFFWENSLFCSEN